MHLVLSKSGASKPLCVIASFGQAFTKGQAWFAGHLSFIIRTMQ